MFSVITCPTCEENLKSADASIGEEVVCPACAAKFFVETIRLVNPKTLSASIDGKSLAEIERASIEAPPLPHEIDPATHSDDSRTKIGRFVIRGVLGQGAFGVVYKAFDPVLQRDVALKVPRFHISNEKRTMRFLTEARAAARLRHENIVPVYESGSTDEQLYIASPVVRGVTLSERLKREPVSTYVALRIVSQIADALAYAHEEGVVHRDIKPANIMLDESGSPAIMDFGLAKLKDVHSSMTGDGSVLGTPMYMAPEQSKGAATVTAASDQYSLGIILYELISGSPPFTGSIVKVLNDASNSPLPPLESRDGPVSKDLAAVCFKALEKTPSDRYSSIADFRDDCQNMLLGRPTKANPASLTRRVLRWGQRNRRAAVLTAFALTCVAVVVVASIGIGVYSNAMSTRMASMLEEARQQEAAVEQVQLQLRAHETELQTRLDEQEARLQSVKEINADLESAKADLEAKQRESDAVRNEVNEQIRLRNRDIEELEARLDKIRAGEELRLDLLGRDAEASGERTWNGYTTMIQSASNAIQDGRNDDAREYLDDCRVEYRSIAWHLLNSMLRANVEDTPPITLEPHRDFQLLAIDPEATVGLGTPFWAEADQQQLMVWDIEAGEFTSTGIVFRQILLVSKDLVVLRLDDVRVLCCTLDDLRNKRIPEAQPVAQLESIKGCFLSNDGTGVAYAIKSEGTGDVFIWYEFSREVCERVRAKKLRRGSVSCASYRLETNDFVIVCETGFNEIEIATLARDGSLEVVRRGPIENRSLPFDARFLDGSSKFLEFDLNPNKGYLLLQEQGRLLLRSITSQDVMKGAIDFPEQREIRIEPNQLIIDDPARQEQVLVMELERPFTDIVFSNEHVLILRYPDNQWRVIRLQTVETEKPPTEPT